MEFVADLHIHTISSGHAYSTIMEIAQAAKNRELKMIAITDHGPAMPGGPHLYHFGNLKVLPEELCGVKIIKGVEANVVDHEGNLDMPERYLKELDWILAGFHPICYPGGTLEENTRAMCRAIENPMVDAIAHPGNPMFPMNKEKVVKTAKRFSKIIEINNSSLTYSREGSEENCQDIAMLAARYKTGVVVGSDAHFAGHVGDLEEAGKIIERAGIKKDQVINTSTWKIERYMKDRRFDFN